MLQVQPIHCRILCGIAKFCAMFILIGGLEHCISERKALGGESWSREREEGEEGGREGGRGRGRGRGREGGGQGKREGKRERGRGAGEEGGEEGEREGGREGEKGKREGKREGGREGEKGKRERGEKVLTSEVHHWINCWMGCCRTMRKLKRTSQGCSLSTCVPLCLFTGSAFCSRTQHTTNITPNTHYQKTHAIVHM